MNSNSIHKIQRTASINVALDKNQRQTLTDQLSVLLADSYTLYLKTQNFHWNVVGPNFVSLHQLFEEQYTDLAGAIDRIAERIRTLDVRSPGSYSEFAKLTSIVESTDDINANTMVSELLKDNEFLAAVSQALFDKSSELGDEVSADLAIERISTHEKNAWMLRSLLNE